MIRRRIVSKRRVSRGGAWPLQKRRGSGGEAGAVGKGKWEEKGAEEQEEIDEEVQAQKEGKEEAEGGAREEGKKCEHIVQEKAMEEKVLKVRGESKDACKTAGMRKWWEGGGGPGKNDRKKTVLQIFCRSVRPSVPVWFALSLSLLAPPPPSPPPTSLSIPLSPILQSRLLLLMSK